MEFQFYSEYELKLCAIRCFIIGTILMGIGGLILFFLSHNFIISKFIVIGGVIASAVYSILIYSRDFIDEKYGIFDSEFPGFSYQYIAILLGCLCIGLSFALFGLGLVQGGIYSAIAFGLTSYFPFIFMFLRLNIYKNENSRWLKTERENGEIYYKKVFGYHPVFYYLIGTIFVMGPLGISFHNLLNSIFLKSYPLNIAVFYFIISLICGCLLLSPDILNKILPFELKTIEGLKKFLYISLIIIAILMVSIILI